MTLNLIRTPEGSGKGQNPKLSIISSLIRYQSNLKSHEVGGLNFKIVTISGAKSKIGNVFK